MSSVNEIDAAETGYGKSRMNPRPAAASIIVIGMLIGTFIGSWYHGADFADRHWRSLKARYARR